MVCADAAQITGQSRLSRRATTSLWLARLASYRRAARRVPLSSTNWERPRGNNLRESSASQAQHGGELPERRRSRCERRASPGRFSANTANAVTNSAPSREPLRKTRHIIISNRPVDAWAYLLGDDVVAAPLLDRLMHQGHLRKFQEPASHQIRRARCYMRSDGHNTHSRRYQLRNSYRPRVADLKWPPGPRGTRACRSSLSARAARCVSTSSARNTGLLSTEDGRRRSKRPQFVFRTRRCDLPAFCGPVFA